MLLTHALAELKLIKKKIENNNQFIVENFIVPAKEQSAKLDRDRSSEIAAAIDSNKDLMLNYLNLKQKIAESNNSNTLTVVYPNGEKVERTVTKWLALKKDLITPQLHLFNQLRNRMELARMEKPMVVTESGKHTVYENQYLISAETIRVEQENIDFLQSNIDSLLSVHNATTHI